MQQPERMQRIGVLGSRRDLKDVIDALHDAGVYHIEEHEVDELDIGEPLPEAEAIDDALVQAKSLLAVWDADNGIAAEPTVDEAISTVQEIAHKHRELLSKAEEARRDVAELETAVAIKNVLDKEGINPSVIDATDALTLVLGTIEDEPDNLDDITTAYDYETVRNDGQTYIALVTTPDNREPIERALRDQGYQAVPIPDDDVHERYEERTNDLNTLETGIAQLRKDNEQAIIDAVAVLDEAAEKAEAPLQFAMSDNMFYIKGYTPKKDAEALQAILEDTTDERIYVETLEMGDDVPIKLDHNDTVAPFEFFMDLYNLPKYNEIDPTFLTFITFPILFGFMLGDFGYGLLTLPFFLVFRNYFPNMRRLSNILIAASVWTIIFGVYFNEAFGFEYVLPYHWPEQLKWLSIHRLDDVTKLLYASIAFGVVHINIGFLMGFANEYKNHGLAAALWEKGGWFILQGAVVLFALTYFQGLSWYYGLAATIAAVIVIYKGEGVGGVVEMPALFSNVLSYARLMAIGMASVNLAHVVNVFAKPFIKQLTVGGILAGTAILITGHFINILLGLFGPFMHSLRLHYVELFTKFFKGGGKPFKAFGGTKWQ